MDSHDTEKAGAYEERLADYCRDRTVSAGSIAKASQVLAALKKRMGENFGN